MVQFFDDEDERELTLGPFEMVEVQGPNMVAGTLDGPWAPIAYFDVNGCWIRDGLNYDRVKIFAAPSVVST